MSPSVRRFVAYYRISTGRAGFTVAWGFKLVTLQVGAPKSVGLPLPAFSVGAAGRSLSAPAFLALEILNVLR